ncbi:hypothetical protein [Brunnivagina elsteri]|uniref:Uncharacterized protein n=1 Tax=Brunnivagina elsteri CCALA 953 TaxID=987040 RepID=A0A2A2TPG5_9CYAN|nr:hypothetical protein [Calothrix elsteri]PAX60379.1 hypothetical protein CK510_02095 [Calothrix elsteri CCALA 953]
MIKHSPKIDNAIGDLPSDRLKDNQALVPETFRERESYTNTLENTKQIAPVFLSIFLCVPLR